MEFAPQPFQLVNGAGGLLLAALGAYVALAKPRRPGNVAFGAFMALFGASFVVANALAATTPRAPLLEATLLLALRIGAIAALVPTVLRFRADLAPDRRPLVAFVAVAAGYLIYISGGITFGLLTPGPLDGEPLFTLGFFGLYGALLAAEVALTLRAAGTPGSQLALVVVALHLYAGFVAGAGATAGASPLDGPTYLFAYTPALALSAALAFVWWRIRRARRTRSARNAAVLMVAAPAVGLVYAALGHTVAGIDAAGYGVVRALAFVVLAFAILRRDLLGLDRRARWTISRGTIAAVFIAVFFIASETAQTFFQDSWGPYVGVLAAGGLVFLIAPLARIAERLAQSAVPEEGETPAERRERFRQQLAIAWSDGRITPKERLLLAQSREHLGLSAEEADALEQEYLAGRAVQS